MKLDKIVHKVFKNISLLGSIMSLLKAFNNHLMEFIDDIIKVFPHDSELITTRFFLFSLMKTKPRNIIKIWKLHIIGPYSQEIKKGNFEFFIEKDYTWDVGEGIDGNKSNMLESIGKMQQKIRSMEASNKEKSMKYIQNLTKLCTLYFLFYSNSYEMPD